MFNQTQFRRLGLAALLSSSLIAGAAQGAESASNYPNRPITYVIGFAGISDAFSRAIGKHLQERLGQPIVIESKLGAQGEIAASSVANAKPDGYVIGMVISNIVTNPLMQRSKVDPLKDLEPITMLGKVPISLVIGTKANPSQDLKQFIEGAKDNPESASFGSAGIGGMTHLTGELVNAEAGIKMVNIPYKGGAPALNDLLGGQLPSQFMTTTLSLRYLSDERVKILAIANEERIPEMPDVPTFTELGYPNVVVNEWYALVAPAGTPPAVIERLNKEVSEILELPDVKQIMPTMVTKGSTPQEVKDFMQSESARWAPFIEKLDLTIQ